MLLLKLYNNKINNHMYLHNYNNKYSLILHNSLLQLQLNHKHFKLMEKNI